MGAGLRYTGSRVTEVTHSARALPLKSYGVLDLNSELSNEHWTFRLFARNVTNRNVYIAATPLVNGATAEIMQVEGIPLEPRKIGFGLDYSF